MPVGPPTRQEYERVEAIIAEKYTAPPPEVVNAGAVLDLSAGGEIEYRGRRYLTLPVSYPIGVELQELMHGLGKVRSHQDEAAAREELLGFFTEAVRLCGLLVRPTGFRGLLWKIGYRRNPFLDASEADLMALVAGFWKCRTMPQVRPVVRHGRRIRGNTTTLGS